MMSKPVVVLFYLDNPSPSEGEHPKYLVQSFLNQKIGQQNPIHYQVIGTVPQLLEDEIKRFDV